jgi:hypothetical protein
MADQPTDAEKALAYTILQAFDEAPPPCVNVPYQGEYIHLYTHGVIEGWLRTVFEDLGLIKPEEDDWAPEVITTISLPEAPKSKED